GRMAIVEITVDPGQIVRRAAQIVDTLRQRHQRAVALATEQHPAMPGVPLTPAIRAVRHPGGVERSENTPLQAAEPVRHAVSSYATGAVFRGRWRLAGGGVGAGGSSKSASVLTPRAWAMATIREARGSEPPVSMVFMAFLLSPMRRASSIWLIWA